MPRYVILEHDWPTRHWDFLLESRDGLRAWRLLTQPDTISPIPAEANTTHRSAYLDYEGPVSGGRGVVVQWDAGTFDWLEDVPGRVVVELQGQKRSGRVRLECLDGKNWIAEWL